MCNAVGMSHGFLFVWQYVSSVFVFGCRAVPVSSLLVLLAAFICIRYLPVAGIFCHITGCSWLVFISCAADLCVLL